LKGQLIMVKVNDVFSHSSPVECINRLLELLRNGQLTDEFARDPVGMIHCIATIIAAGAEWLKGDNNEPEVFASSGFEQGCKELCTELGGVPAGAGRGILLQLLLPIVMKKLQEMLDEWLSNRDT